jgi:DNA/RNA-binding domain of Phe-tRNA-synthetase-like protein
MSESIEISIHPAIFERFPGVAVHAFRVARAADAAACIEASRFLGDAVDKVRRDNYDLAKLADSPVVRSWRDAYGISGLQPSKFRSSIESLLRRALKDGGSLETGIPTVDIYNSCSLMHLAPLGAYDIARLPSPEIILRPVNADTDSFLPLGGESKDFPLRPTLVVYASGANVLCYGFNCRDSQLTALRPESQVAIFCSESTSPTQRAAAEQALTHLHDLLSSARARPASIMTIDFNHPKAELRPPE